MLPAITVAILLIWMIAVVLWGCRHIAGGGVQLHFEQDISGPCLRYYDGRLFAQNFEMLDALARRQLVRPLSDFELGTFKMDPTAAWYSPEEMLRTFCALDENAILHSEIACVGDAASLSAVLRTCEDHLRNAHRHGVNVRLTIHSRSF